MIKKRHVFTGTLLTVVLSFGTTGIAVADSNVDVARNLELAEMDLLPSVTGDVKELLDFIADKDVVAKVDYGDDEEILWGDGNGRSILAEANGFSLALLEGDSLEVMPEGDTAIWHMQDGTPLIEFDAQVLFSDGNERLMFNKATGMLSAIVTNSSDGMHAPMGFSAPTRRCANKYVGFGFSLLWEGLVCVPASLGTGGALGVAIAC